MLTIRSLARMLAFAALFPLAVACGHSDDGDEAGAERVPDQLQQEKIAYAHGQEIFVVKTPSQNLRRAGCQTGAVRPGTRLQRA